MKSLTVLQIINEEINTWFNDYDQNTLDAYSDKFLGSQNSSQPTQQIQIDGELIGYVTKEWARQLPTPIPIYKNPKSLNGVGIGARGVLLNNGDFYLTPSANAMHDNILTVLSEKGIIPHAKAYQYYNNYPEEFIAVQRVFRTNTFSQSASYDKFPQHYEEIFRLGNQKHPYQFKAVNLNEIESPLDPMNQYSNIPPGYDANILYEESDDIDDDKNRGILKRTGEKFWINANGIQTEWTMGNASPNILNNIKKQIKTNMKTNYVQKVVEDVLNEFVNENKEEKYYIWTDKTGRGEKPIKLTKSHIEKTWDLDEQDYFDVPLYEYLENSYIDDVWETTEQRLVCIEIH